MSSMLKELEQRWQNYFAVEFGISRDDFFKKLDEIRALLDTKAKPEEVMAKIRELNNMLKPKAISSNSTGMIRE